MPKKLLPARWTLRQLLTAPKGAPLRRVTTQLERSVRALEKLRPLLADNISPADFTRMLRITEELAAAASRIGAYAGLWFSENTQDQAALAFQGRIQQITTDARNRVLFFSLWWKGLPAVAAARLLAASPKELRHHLALERKATPYVLPERDEQLLNIKDVNGVNGLTTVYSMLTNAYKFNLLVDGSATQLTRDALMTSVRKADPALRAAAYQELYRVYAEDGLVLAQIYTHRVRDWHAENVKLRGYRAAVAVRNLDNDIPDPVIATLLRTCRKNRTVFQRWFRVKARLLGLKKLRRYDIYAPLSGAEKIYPYDEAVKLVLDTFQKFSPAVARAARRVFDENHIDAEVRPGKRGGAFCASVLPGMTPYVLQNYTGDVRDVATLAHELGHAIHSVLAARHSVFTFHSALPLAETSSTFAEMLLTDRLLAQDRDPAVRRQLIADTLDDAYATIMRQAYFTLFEQQAHALIQSGAGTDELNAAYMRSLREQFGSAVEIAPEFKWEWVSIPHIFYTPFYCYAYSFGQLLVLALYQRYKKQGARFTPHYLKILAYGGSASPQHILEEAGIDITTPSFWQGGFDFISGLLDELESGLD